ncbi:MAG: sporulation protein YqfD [Clostridia bacterium]|nr:sporulation protein YqfD [Clostridia bacterium]
MALLVKLKNALTGSAKITSGAENTPHIISYCIKTGLPYEKMAFSEGNITIRMSLYAAKKLAKLLREDEIPFEIREGGLPVLLAKYKKRYGLMAGALIIIALLFFSGRYVWDIRVSGNSTLTAAEVKAELANAGFGNGYEIGLDDVDDITNSVLINSEKIAWMSINMRGNVAYVQIREKINAEGEFGGDMSGDSNMVASRDGIIEYIEVMRGTSAVTEGQSVREGELLISGISESTHGEYRTEHALGRVYAITNRHFSVKIPLKFEKKVLSEPVCTKKTVKFFSKYINIFRNYGNLGTNCVKIEEENSFSLFGLPDLPVSILSEMTMEYETVNAIRSAQQASELAFFELERLIETELASADLLRKTISTEMTENEFLLECEIVCLENIAVSMPMGEE